MEFRRVVLSAFVLTIAACGVFGSEDPPAEETTPDGGPGGPPPPPPISGTPIAGVFVSSSKGIPDGDGAMSRPLKTLAAAFDLAKKKNLPVIACAETFTEAVKLIDGVTAYGFFDCSQSEWKRVDKHATIQSPTTPAVTVEGLTLPARFEGFEIFSPDLPPITEGVRSESSVGMWVKGTVGLALANVVIRSGKGQDGIDGAEPGANADTGAPHGVVAYQQGKGCVDLVLNYCINKQFEIGSAGGTSKCTVGANGGPGGQGGDGVVYYGATRKGAGAFFSGRPNPANTSTAQGGAPGDGPPRTAFLLGGVVGPAGVAGAAGQNVKWTATILGFGPATGTAGMNGLAGLGGGGGGGSLYWQTAGGVTSPPSDGDPYHYGGIGGGGGAGGCGGLAGKPGTGGGASIALYVIDSDISIESSRLESGRGGRAGKGALGSEGNSGGNGGVAGSPDYEFGATGGKGGKGGDGGPSGHGSAGPSIVLAYHGKKPDLLTGTTLVAGAAGDGQPSIARGDKIVPAVVGEAMNEHSF